MLDSIKTNPFAPTKHEYQKSRLATGMKWLTLAMCLVLIIPVFAIILDIFIQGAPALTWDFLWQNPKRNGTQGGIWAPLIGTFYLTLISLLIVAPIGILGGVYLNEYAKDNWVTRVIMMAVTSLAGVPSIVHALFGLGAFVLFMKLGPCLLAGALTIAVMNLPVIITATREALSAVPRNFREACWNLGASKWQTIRTVVLPNSISGILTGVILEVSRAAGETAPILFAGAVFKAAMEDELPGKLMPYGLDDKFMALSYHLHIISTQVSNMPDKMKFATAAVLIMLIMAINALSILLRGWMRSRKKW